MKLLDIRIYASSLKIRLMAVLAVKCLLILGPTKRKVSGDNLPFPKLLCTSGMQQLRTFPACNLYYRVRPLGVIGSTPSMPVHSLSLTHACRRPAFSVGNGSKGEDCGFILPPVPPAAMNEKPKQHRHARAVATFDTSV
jgi:hypothetical protein